MIKNNNTQILANKVKRVPVVMAFTRNYFIPAATGILSVLKNSMTSDSFHFICLLAEPLPSVIEEKLENINKDRSLFTFINMESKLKNININERYTVAAYYRLLLPNILLQYSKVVYMDCDMIIRNNLANLFNEIELGHNYLAGVFEATLEFQIQHMTSIGCEPGKYVNSGFLIMNLELLRRDGMVQKFLKALQQEKLEFPDQDVLNQLCKDRILGIPPYYNSIRTFNLPQYKVDFLRYYTKRDWEEVQMRGSMHYTGGKPWNEYAVKFDIWWNYYRMLPSDVKSGEPINNNMRVLSMFYTTIIGRLLIDGLQKVYRKMKYA